MAVKKGKSVLDIMKEIRTTWNINPRTRVQENEKEDKKKRRQSERKQIKKDLDDI